MLRAKPLAQFWAHKEIAVLILTILSDPRVILQGR